MSLSGPDSVRANIGLSRLYLVLGLVCGQVPLHVVQQMESPATHHTGVGLHHCPEHSGHCHGNYVGIGRT